MPIYICAGDVSVRVPSTLRAWLRLCGTKVDASSEIAEETQIQSSEGKAVLTGEELLHNNHDLAGKGLTLQLTSF